MWIFLDLIVLAIVALYVFLSAKHGFVRTAIELVGFFVAIYLSFTLSGMFANLTYDNMIEPALVKNITESVDAEALSNVSSTVDAIWDSLPSFVSSAAEKGGNTKAGLNDELGQSVTQNTEQVVKNALEYVAKPFIVGITKAMIFVILLVILLILVRFLAKIINAAFKIPIVGGINKTLGGALGLLKGALIAAAVCICLTVLVDITKDGFFIFTKENIDNSYLFRTLSNLNPFYK